MTPQDLTKIINGIMAAIEPVLMDHLDQRLDDAARGIDKRIKTETYKLLDSLVGSELREMVRKQVQGGVSVDVKVEVV